MANSDSSQAIWMPRSMRRPTSRKRQPAKRYMFSWTRPVKPASLRRITLMARTASSPAVTVRPSRRAVLARSRRAIQPSGEKRSRMRAALVTALSIAPVSPAGIGCAVSTPSGSR